MSNTKTEAQRLADGLIHEATKRVCNVAMMPYSLPIDAAKELRRLDAAHTVAVELAAQYAAERDQLRAQVERLQGGEAGIDGNTSDGYHTFNELYEFRKAYNAALFNEWASSGKCNVHKSWRHHDGELCFGGGWFIVVAVLPDGQISNHYEANDWDLFTVPESERALFEFDGHTGSDVISRLKLYTAQPAAPALVPDEMPTRYVVTEDRSYEVRSRQIIALNQCNGDLDDKLDAAIAKATGEHHE